MSLAEICENAKMAREYALLGNYDTSLVYYQGVIQQIQKHIQQLKDDAIMKQEWHQVCKNNFILWSQNMLTRRKLKNAAYLYCLMLTRRR